MLIANLRILWWLKAVQTPITAVTLLFGCLSPQVAVFVWLLLKLSRTSDRGRRNRFGVAESTASSYLERG